MHHIIFNWHPIILKKVQSILNEYENILKCDRHPISCIQPYSSSSYLFVLEAAPSATTVIHHRLPWFPSPSMSFIIAGRAAAVTVSFWSRRRNHRRRKVLCHANRIFLFVIHYWVPHFFIRSSLLRSGYFYPHFRTGFRIFLSVVGHLASRYFYAQLWKNGLWIFLSTRGIWLADNF